MLHTSKIVRLDDPLGLFSLKQAASEVSTEAFRGAAPFPHVVIESPLDAETVDNIHRQIMQRPSSSWEKNADDVEVKWRSRWQSEYDIPEPARELVRFLNSGAFLRELSRLTGIPHLIADPYYTGGGFNLSGQGGKLDVHVDGNWHDQMAVHRRLNLIVYFNRDWCEEWGGALGLYDRTGETCVAAHAPIGNRIVIFETNDHTYHGFPEPIDCPADQARTSLALYYYTAAPRPADQISIDQPHSALWKSRGNLDKRGNKTRDRLT